MPRYYPGDHTDDVVPGIPAGDGRKNADNETKDTWVVAMTPIEGVIPGTAVQVGSKRATWLIYHGFATRLEDYKTAHPGVTVPGAPTEEPAP